MKKLWFLLLSLGSIVQLNGMENDFLRPDSLNHAGIWINIMDESISGNEFSSLDKKRIRKIDEFRPFNNVDNKNKAVIVVTHGTWGTESTQYFKEREFKDKEKQNYLDIKRFATWYAFAHKKTVDLISFLWSGELSDQERINAADFLKKYLEENYEIDTKTSFISHSHGCNVINNLSQKLLLPIDMIIHLACPIRGLEGKKYGPKNFKQLIHFYSEGDAVEPLGRYPEWMLKLFALTEIGQVAYPLINNSSESIKSKLIKSVAIGTSFMIMNKYLYHLCIDNYFERQDNAIIIGLKTKINGKDPGHSDIRRTGHPEIADTLIFLPEILTKLYREYPAHVANSCVANLDIKGSENSECSINISDIKLDLDMFLRYKKNHKLPEVIPFIGFKASHIKNENDLKELHNIQLKNDWKKCSSLNDWVDEEFKINKMSTKTTDNYGCKIEFIQIKNIFNQNDLEAEHKKSNSLY
ncbi:MAG: hypothetical protein WDZ41_02420 [Candidatus Babeliales bacterium]